MSVGNVQGNVGASFTPNSSPSVLDRFLDLISRIFSVFSCFQNNTDTTPDHQSNPLAPGRVTPPSRPRPPASSKGVSQESPPSSEGVGQESPRARRVKDGLSLMTKRLNNSYYNRGNFQKGWNRIIWLCGKIEKLSDARAETSAETRLREIISRLSNVEGLDTLQQAPTILTNIRGRVDAFNQRKEFTAAYDELGDLLDRLKSCTKLNGYGDTWRQALELRTSLEAKYKGLFPIGSISTRRIPQEEAPRAAVPAVTPTASTSRASELEAVIHRAALDASAPRPTLAQLKEHARMREATVR